MNRSGWYVWGVCEYNADGELTRVTTVKTDTRDQRAALRVYLAEVKHLTACGYPRAESYSVTLSH